MTYTMFGAILLTGGLLAIASAEPAQVPIPKVPAGALPGGDVDPQMPMFLSCAKAADDCARHCEMCSAHCTKLLAEGKKEHLET